MRLTLTEANSIIRRATAKAEEIGIHVCVAVCDEGGRLIAFARMDGAKWASAYGAQGKAITVPSGGVVNWCSVGSGCG